jgi:DNA-directed RNA polymerase specialized sigma subunit
LDDALNELTTFDERQSKIVQIRFFGGLSLEETAEALKISTRRRAARIESGSGVALS